MAESGDGSSATSNGKPKGHLTAYIVGAIIAAIIVALISPRFAASVGIGGEIFLRLLKMMVVPLVVASVMSGILGLGDTADGLALFVGARIAAGSQDDADGRIWRPGAALFG